MHHQREPRQLLLDLCQHVKVQALTAAELKSPMARANRHRQRVAAAALNKLARLGRVSQHRIGFIHLNMLLNAA